jgi:hypothetical protein
VKYLRKKPALKRLESPRGAGAIACASCTRLPSCDGKSCIYEADRAEQERTFKKIKGGVS